MQENNKRKIKFESFGAPLESKSKEYTCFNDWDQNVFLQCGDRGVVFKKDGGGYSTAFFEAFYLDNFIRGEGKTLRDAENEAFKKLMKIKNCPSHNYQQEKEGLPTAVCSLCGSVKNRFFKPSNVCSQCGKQHVNLKIDESSVCLTHYMQTLEKQGFAIDQGVINNIKKEIFDNIQSKEQKNENFIDKIMNKENKSINSPQDIKDHDLRVEMELNKIKKAEVSFNVFQTLIKMGVDKKYDEEYQFVYVVEDLQKTNYNVRYSKMYEIIQEKINDLVCKKIISADPKHLNLSYTEDSEKPAIEKVNQFLNVFQIDLKLAKLFPEFEQQFVACYFNKSLEEKSQEINNELIKDIIEFYSVEYKKPTPKMKI